MNSINYNLYAGAFLGTVFVAMTVSMISEAIFDIDYPEQPGYVVVVPEGSGSAVAEAPEEEELAPITPLLASADISAGESGFRKCSACHSIAPDGGNKVGPALWSVINREVASIDGFSYSSALQNYSDGGTVWDFEAMNRFLHKPKGYINGTSMGFAGLSRENDRANIIAYLNSQSEAPVPVN
ncbi:MAG: cytochrome c family protein [Pseudomonadota bacterium]